MNHEDFEVLKTISRLPVIPIRGVDLINQTNRTLVYGYTKDRGTFHVYLKDGCIHIKIYGLRGSEWVMDEDNVLTDESYVPDKRAYPETCDFEFCKLLRYRGICIPFTTWTDGREVKQFYGEID